MKKMMQIELLSDKNFNENSLDEYERRHDVKRVYRRKGTEYVLVDMPYVEDWSLEEKRQIAKKISGQDYRSYIALADEKVVGFIAMKKKLYEDYMIVDEMYVSAKCRGEGIGRKLFDLGKEEAKKAGARALYMSACSSEETIAFYRTMGAILTDHPIRSLAEKEPYDLQMVCKVE